MVVALRDVRVRGEIHTIIDYAADMLQVRAEPDKYRAGSATRQCPQYGYFSVYINSLGQCEWYAAESVV
jgi:hypothetical protein